MNYYICDYEIYLCFPPCRRDIIFLQEKLIRKQQPTSQPVEYDGLFSNLAYQ